MLAHLKQAAFATGLTSAIALGAGVLAAPAQAFNFTTTGTWSDVVGGTNIQFPTDSGENQVRWGTSTGNGQSGLGFTGNSGSAGFGDIFQLGTLRHFNQAISAGTAASAVDLTIDLNFGGSLPIPAQSFTYNMQIDETPNAAPCTYPGTSICPDQISFANPVSAQSFDVDGTTYVLELLGFRATSDAPLVDNFISEEGGTNSALLFGRVVERSAAIPEPLTMGGVALAGVGLAAVRRRQKQQS